jgi:hypothetical protein
MSIAELLATPLSDQEPTWAEDRWVVMVPPQVTSAPRFRLLRGPVEFDYDPDDRPHGTLVMAREDPELV